MRARGRRAHGKPGKDLAFCCHLCHSLPDLGEARLWLPFRGSHRDTLWPKWAQHLCTPGQPGLTVLLLQLSAWWQHIPGLSNVAFAGRDWFMRPPSGLDPYLPQGL